MIASRETSSNSVMLVHHAGNAIKAETVEHVYVHVVSKVREQKPKHFMVTVIEQPGIPELVSSSDTLVKVEVIGTIKLVDPVGIVVNPEEHERRESLTRLPHSYRRVSGPHLVRR